MIDNGHEFPNAKKNIGNSMDLDVQLKPFQKPHRSLLRVLMKKNGTKLIFRKGKPEIYFLKKNFKKKRWPFLLNPRSQNNMVSHPRFETAQTDKALFCFSQALRNSASDAFRGGDLGMRVHDQRATLKRGGFRL